MSLFSSHSNRNEFMCTFNVVYFTCIENKDSASIFHVLFTSVFFKSDSCSRSTEFSFAYASPAYQFICEKNRNESDWEVIIWNLCFSNLVSAQIYVIEWEIKNIGAYLFRNNRNEFSFVLEHEAGKVPESIHNGVCVNTTLCPLLLYQKIVVHCCCCCYISECACKPAARRLYLRHIHISTSNFQWITAEQLLWLYNPHSRNPIC